MEDERGEATESRMGFLRGGGARTHVRGRKGGSPGLLWAPLSSRSAWEAWPIAAARWRQHTTARPELIQEAPGPRAPGSQELSPTCLLLPDPWSWPSPELRCQAYEGSVTPGLRKEQAELQPTSLSVEA